MITYFIHHAAIHSLPRVRQQPLRPLRHIINLLRLAPSRTRNTPKSLHRRQLAPVAGPAAAHQRGLRGRERLLPNKADAPHRRVRVQVHRGRAVAARPSRPGGPHRQARHLQQHREGTLADSIGCRCTLKKCSSPSTSKDRSR